MFSKSIIGMDIGSSSIKLVELSDGKNKRLKKIGIEPLPNGAVVDGGINNTAVVIDAMSGLLKRMKIRPIGRKAAISMAGSSVLVKKIWLPAANPGELFDLINAEAEQSFHADLNELYWQHTVLSEVPDDQGDIPILLVAASRDIVDQVLDVIRSVGLRTAVVDCDVFSTLNLLEYNLGILPEPSVVINIGAKSTQLGFVKEGEYLYTRDVAFGGDDYTETIVSTLNVNKKTAESMKIEAVEGNASDELMTVINDLNAQFTSQIATTISDFVQASSDVDDKPGGLYLVGGGSKVIGLDAAIAAEVQSPTQSINPFHKIDVNKSNESLEYVLEKGHLFGVATGLALRKIKEN